MSNQNISVPRSVIEKMLAVLEDGEGHKLGCKVHAFSDTCTCGYEESVNAAIKAGHEALARPVAA